MRTVPTGTVTFLFTDIEGSTAAWESAPAAMRSALARHDALLRAVFDDHGGYVFATAGDGFAVAFATAGDAVSAAVEGQRGLRSEPWPQQGALRIRMGLHSGESYERDGDYFGPEVNRAARLMATAHGGQVVLSGATHELLGGPALVGVSFEDAGLHRLRGLQRREQVFHLVVDDQRDFASLRSLDSDRHNLPAARTSFVGRRAELDALASQVDRGSLVTVVGPGGMGKTRLVLAHAWATIADWPDGVWFVDLSDVTSDDQVADAVLTAVGLPTGGLGSDAPAAVAEQFARWRAAIVLDNCEQVLDGAAEVAEEILARCPDVGVVATSREPLAVEGERLLRVGGLGPDSADASRLFFERVRLTTQDFDPSNDDMAKIEDLCAELDGMPLAIELAAARTAQLGLTDLSAGLLYGTTDRGQRRRHQRHRSIQSVVQWSLDLMTDLEQKVFRRLGVFEGGFTLDAARFVTTGDVIAPDDVEPLILSLVDRSMVDSRRLPYGTRFRLLGTIRAQALNELRSAGEINGVRDQHQAWVTEWSARAGIHQSSLWWFPSPIELPNQRAALQHALKRDAFTGAVTLFKHALGAFYASGAVREAAQIYQDLRARADEEDPKVAGDLDACEMILAEVNGDFVTSHGIAERLRADTDDDDLWFLASVIMGHHLGAIDPPAALAVYDEVDARIGPTPLSAYGRGEAAITAGRFEDAVDAILDAFGINDVADIPPSTPEAPLDVIILSDLAVALHFAGHTEEAHVVIDALAAAISDGAIAYSCVVPLLRAVAGGSSIPASETVTLLREAAELERQWAVPVMAYDCVAGAALAAIQHGRPDVAARAYAAIHRGPSRSVGAFAWRTTVQRQTREQLERNTRAELTERGKGDDPRTALDQLLNTLAADDAAQASDTTVVGHID